MTDSILVIGQSHVAAIRAAARIRREHDPDRPRTRVIHTLEPRYSPELEEQGNAFSEPLAAEIRSQIERHRPRIASCIGGNYHNALSLIRHPRPFDFLLADGADDIATGAEIVPRSLVRAAMLAGMAGDIARLRLFAAAAGPFLHLESPPPLADGAWIAAQADRFFQDRGVAAFGVAPASLRYKMWRLHSEIVGALCQEIGARFLPVPVELCDPDGMLRPEFAQDATHGNAAYGEAMIRSIEDAPWPI